MTRSAARVRLLVALLLLVVGQLGAAASAHAACRRAQGGRELPVAVAGGAAHPAPLAAARPGGPAADPAPVPAAAMAVCAAVALPEWSIAVRVPPAPAAPPAIDSESSTGRSFGSTCFRPPRVS